VIDVLIRDSYWPGVYPGFYLRGETSKASREVDVGDRQNCLFHMEMLHFASDSVFADIVCAYEVHLLTYFYLHFHTMWNKAYVYDPLFV